MSWNNAVPLELFLGPVELKPKAVENPDVRVPDELVTDCLVRYRIDDYGMTASQDHPAFAELRRVLASRGYISIPDYACVNGDKVVKRFCFNGFQLEPGDRFYCAGAWKTRISIRSKKND